MDVHDVRGGIDAHPPNVIKNHGACDDSARVPAHVFQQCVLLSRELQKLFGSSSLMLQQVEFEIGNLEACGLLRR